MFALQAIGSGRTLYASNKDKAVAASEILHGYARAGYFPPITVSAGLDTIDASQVDSTFLGHSDFATERPLLNDIFLWLTQGLPPARRPSLQVATTADGAVYWQLT
jgi:esterase/lipase superfamily enzyme